MPSASVKTFFYRVLLPAALFTGAFLRPSFISLAYVFLGLFGPAFPSIYAGLPVSRSTKSYLIFTVVIALASSIAQFVYQIYEHVAYPKSQEFTDKCNSTLVYWCRQVGLSRMIEGNGFTGITVILPEIIVLAASLVTLIVCSLSTSIIQNKKSTSSQMAVQPVRVDRPTSVSGGYSSRPVVPALKRLSDISIVLFLSILGALQPSALNSAYFFTFVLVSFWWAIHTPLDRANFNRIKLFIVGFLAIHFIAIFVYQIEVVHTALPPGTLAARLIGLSPLLTLKCEGLFAWTETSWTAFINAISVISAFHIVLLQYQWTKNGISAMYRTNDDDGSSVHEEEDPDGGHELSTISKISASDLDKQKITHIFNGAGSGNFLSHALISICSFLLHHCYAVAMLAMMTWALLYHSVFGLVFLVAACVIWIFRNTRKVTFAVSPILLLYALSLLIIQYIYSLDWGKESEQISGDILTLIGLIVAQNRTLAFTTLLVKTGLSLPLFILLRLHLRERHYNSLTDHDRLKRFTYGTFGNTRPDLTQPRTNHANFVQASQSNYTVSYITATLAKYWIFVVAVVLLVNAIPTPPVFYTVGYFFFWSTLVLVFLTSFALFRATLRLYWTLLIFYTSVVIIALYCYQFEPIPKWWDNLTGLSEEWNQDIGLINYKLQEESNGTFVLRLIGPISLFAVVVMQLKFFHDPWMELVRSPVDAERVGSAEQAHRGRSLFAQAKTAVNDFIEILWRIAEVHIRKVVLIILISVTVGQICALNFVVVVLTCVAVCIPTCSGLIGMGLCIYLMLIGTGKMIFQMHFIHQNSTEDFTNCTNLGYNTNETLVGWLGFRKNPNVFDELGIIIAALVSLSALVFVNYRQRHARLQRGEPQPPPGIVFPDVLPKDFDLSFLHCIKFFINHGFYKFGLEISMCMMVAVAWMRMDLIGAVTVVWLFIFCLSSRIACRRIWPVFLTYLTVLIPLQYAMFVGLPREYCLSYPWSHWLSNANQNDNLVLWLDLANYIIEPNHRMLIIDFLLFLVVAAQERVFRAEGADHPAGENTSIYSTREFAFHAENPHYDFVSRQKSSVDFFKITIFMYGHWITLVMVFVAGLGGTSLFALGYLVLAFWMLWQGNNLYTMKNYRRTIGRWNSLLFYTVLVMFCKVALQVVGCVYLRQLVDLCFLRQLFSIVCVVPRMHNDVFPEQANFTEKCAASANETMIGFDALSFVMLIFQLRILHSWYFQYCMLDFRSELVLSNRGAVLTNQLIEKEMKEQNQQQKNKLDEIKQRTSAIRKRYEEQLQKGTEVFHPETYGQDYSYDQQRPGRRVIRRMTSEFDENDPCPGYSLKYVQQMQKLPAKRAGDYYMFDYDPQTDDLVQPVESFVPEVTPGAGDFDKLDPAQLVHVALHHDNDLEGTLNAVESAERIKDEEQRMITAVRAPSKTSVHRTISNDEEVDGESEDGEEEPAKPLSEKIKSVLRFAGKIIGNACDWAAALMNRQSRDHRYVAYVLNKEKEKLKSHMRETLFDVSKPIVEVGREWDRRDLHCVSSESDIERLENEAHDQWIQKKVFLRLLTAVGNCVAAHTDILCYFMAIIAHARCCGLITLPFPLLVFFWGTLASPRPSKLFWVTMITYTELVILMKFVFQFDFFPWNSQAWKNLNQKDVYDFPRLLGIQKLDYFAFWDVALLISLFFHRYMLRRLGLWKDANISDTFQNGIEQDATSDAEIQQNAEDQHAGPSDATSDSEQNDPNPNNVGIPEPERGAFSSFIYKLFHPKFYYIRDLYPYMFLLDVLCFFIVSFGYSSFGEGGTGDVLKDIQSNRVPLTFVIMLIVISMMIVIDRGLYLRKAVICKLIYQMILVVFMHIWIFFVLPTITQRAALDNGTAQILYIVKCIYLFISAWQIRNGYPNLCIGNWITHSYGLMNMVFFKIFMAIPFLFELRTSIDWTWTDTSMPLFDFFNMENFYATIYNIKCARNYEQAFPAPRGVPKAASVKYMMGLPMIIILVLIIWCPLLAFSLLNRIGQVVTPDHVKLSVGLEGYPALYTMDSQGLELIALSDDELNSLRQKYARSRGAVSFLDDYTTSDTLKVRFRPESEVFWDISTESLDAMHYELTKGTKPLKLSVQLEFIRPRVDKTKEPTRHSSEVFVTLKKGEKLREDFATLLENMANSTKAASYGPIVFSEALPPFVIVPNEGEVKPANALLDVHGNSSISYSGLNFTVSTTDIGSRLWIGQMKVPPAISPMLPALEKIAYGDKNKEYIEITAFVDRVFPSIISKYVQGGIIAMYVAVVLLVGKLLRGLITNKPTDVIITEIPNADYLLKICLDIYLVREAKDFILEQDLFAKLIFLFRSPATLIKWTKFKVKTD
uniref:Piezo-type mechanosensitive ion channel component n=1 Tax=Steinernema glaseri TaxID=37863 RepID=A0A1I7Z562_9BILA